MSKQVWIRVYEDDILHVDGSVIHDGVMLDIADSYENFDGKTVTKLMDDHASYLADDAYRRKLSERASKPHP